MRRRLPRWSEFEPLLRPGRIPLDPTERRLGRAHTIPDLRKIAARRVPRAVFDYTDGAAEREISLRRARNAFARVEFHPQALRDVSDPDHRHHGARAALGPAVRAGPDRVHPDDAPRGRTGGGAGRAAGRGDVLAVHHGHRLDRGGGGGRAGRGQVVPAVRVEGPRRPARTCCERAHAAGYEALLLTVDTPVGGARMRDVRNGLTVPPALTPATVLDAAVHPTWWFNLLTTEPLSFASLNEWRGTVAELVNTMFDPTVTFADIEWLRAAWPGPLLLKGIQTVADARAAVDHGADGIVISTHGGRQLDRAAAPLEVLPRIADAVGDRAEILLDTGIMHGGDIVAALALGARACLVGRAFLYGLMAGGERGVDQAIGILGAEITRTLQLLGVRSAAELNRSHVSLR